MKSIVYLHGFRSSSRSVKARLLGDALVHVHGDWEYATPDLSFDPALAFRQITAATRHMQPADLTLVGSSLGGYYAICMATKLHCRAVLLNPSIKPFETLAAQVGTQTNLHSGEQFTFTDAHVATLREHFVEQIARPEDFLTIVEMGDEILDHHATLDYLQRGPNIRVDGGDHELRSFPQHIQRILAFAGVVNPQTA